MIDFAATGLPLAPFLGDIGDALARDKALVLRAEPGSGKTSLVPAYLATRPEFRGRVVVLEPRRLAAAAAARRVSELAGDSVGGFAGYRVRFERRVTDATRVEFVTEALAVRSLIDDPALEGVSVLAFDEFHERSTDADLALALALEARSIRPELAILLMSATLDAERLSSFLGCGVVDAPGRVFPVSTSYRPLPDRFWETPFAEAVAELADSTPGDVLAFLPGMAEIRRVEARLRESGARSGIAILHGSMPLDEQRAVIAPEKGAPKRIVLATDIAESSLTVPRVTAVADSGYARVSRFHARSGMDRLVTERIPIDRADQRRGRAGRLGPGACVRFWGEREALSASRDPELLRTELSAAFLSIAAFGERDPRRLRWLDPAPDASWNAARELLVSLRLVDSDGSVNARGTAASRMGTHPRLAAIVQDGADSGDANTALACAAALAELDSGGRTELSLAETLEALARGRAARDDDRAFLERVDREIERLSRAAGLRFRADAVGPSRAARHVAAGYPDRIARLVGERVYAFPSGRRAKTRPELAAAEWIVAPDVDAGDPEGVVRACLPLSPAEADALLRGRTTNAIDIEWDGWKAKAAERIRYGAIVVGERRIAAPIAFALADAVVERVRREGFRCLPLDAACESFVDRCRYAAGQGIALPDFSDEALARDAAEWLAPFVAPDLKAPLDERAALAALRFRAGDAAAALDRDAPGRFVTPAGTSKPIEYQTGADPRVEVRIQDLFGLADGPRLLGRPLVFLLLSPADRPLQTTADLAGFWRSTWPILRKEMKIRYPKHRWPENPLDAEPGVRRRPAD